MKALLVVDMLNDFIRKDGALYCGEISEKIIPFIKSKLDEAHREKKSGRIVIYICDAHKENDLEFKMFPKHCIDGTKGAEVIEELKPEPWDIVLKKTRYSGFYNTNLAEILKSNKVTEVELVGACTSICVMDTAGELRNRDYKVIVYKDGVADFDLKAHKFALKRMEKIYGCKIH